MIFLWIYLTGLFVSLSSAWLVNGYVSTLDLLACAFWPVVYPYAIVRQLYYKNRGRGRR